MPGPLLLVATNSEPLPAWLAWPMGALCLAGCVGLVWCLVLVIQLYNPSENYYELPAASLAYRFRLTRAGRYELACARPSQGFSRYLELPDVQLLVRQQATGHEQELSPGWLRLQRASDLGGDPAVTFDTFTAPAPGDYELLNPSAARFPAGDRLRILPATFPRNVLLILAILGCATAAIGGFILALIAATAPRP